LAVAISSQPSAVSRKRRTGALKEGAVLMLKLRAYQYMKRRMCHGAQSSGMRFRELEGRWSATEEETSDQYIKRRI
jgi:hypothetical protein